jgi:multiple sugar transport system substrate-binding protein
MRYRSRALVAVIAGAPLVFLAACGGGSSGTASSSGGGSKSGGSCSAAPAGTKVTLSYSSWVPGFQKVVDIWNAQNPDIHVSYKNIPGGNATYTNYVNQLKAGTIGDMGFVDYAQTATFRAIDGLTDISSCPGVKEATSKFLPWTITQSALGQSGALYGVPHNVGPLGLFYRKDLFAKAGIAVPKTWDEYYQAAVKIRKLGSYIADISPGDSSGLLEAMAWQNGAKWFTNDGKTWTVNMTDPKSLEVADLLQKLISQKLVANYPLFGDANNKGSANGTVWSQLAGAWGGYYVSTGAPKTTGKWAVAETPTWKAGQDTAGNWGGANIVVWKTSKHPAEAAKFLLWAMTDPAALALNVKNGGVLPATTDATTEVPALKQPSPFFGNQDTWGLFAKVASKVDTSWQYGPVQISTDAALSDGLAKVVSGSATVADALRQAEATTKRNMQSQAIPVNK